MIIPTFSERESNARRIASLGAGEFVLPQTGSEGRKRIDLQDFQAKVMQVLSNVAYLENAKRYSEILRSCGGAEKAALLIRDFSVKRIPTPRQP